MSKIKDYKVNLGVLVLYETLDALRGVYDDSLPKKIDDELEKFIRLLTNYLPVEDSKYKRYDFEDVDYFMKVRYRDK